MTTESADGNSNDELFSAIGENDLNMVRRALNHGADVNAKNKNKCTPLFSAAGEGASIAVCDLLLEYGADVNEPNRTGSTPLHAAVYNILNSFEMCRWLIENGAIVNAVDDLGRTPLDGLRWDDSKDDIKRLLRSNGAH